MKITAVDTLVLRAELPRIVADSFNRAVHWGMPCVVVHTDEGLTGTGYTSTLGHGDEAIKDVIDRCYTPVLLDRDPICTQELWERLYWSDAHWVGRLGITQMALAAVDIALWDLKAKVFGVPLWKLIGGHKAGRVRSYNTDGGWLNLGVNQLIEEMTSFVEQGWTGVKMKIGGADPREDVRRVAAVRTALPSDIDLMLDVNQRWNRTTAITWAPRFEEFEIAWLEEPLDPDDVDGHARLREVTAIPIALGEHVYSRTAFRDFLVRADIAYVQADVTRLGGITEWLAVAEMANAFDVPVVPHAGDLTRIHQHLGAGHVAVPMIECLHWLQDLWEEPAVVRDGWFHVPETPGASTTLVPDAIAKFRVA